MSADDLPIADYDFLGVSEILPLLGELDDDELELVRDYEDATRGRATILYRIDSILGVTDAQPPPPEPEPAPSPQEAPASAPEASGSDFPIANYDKLRVFQIMLLVGELDAEQLEAVRHYEQAGRSRVSIINQIDSQLAARAAGVAATPAAAPAPAAPARRRA